MSTGPDWTIHTPGSEGRYFTEGQRVLMHRLERELPDSRGEPLDASELEMRVSAIISNSLRPGSSPTRSRTTVVSARRSYGLWLRAVNLLAPADKCHANR